MSLKDNLHQLHLDIIVRRCSEETAKWQRRLAQDTRYCFELFRRGIGDGMADALLQIYALYVPLLARRAERHPAISAVNEDTQHLARIALAHFCKSCMQKGFLTRFIEFKPMMNYLIACLHTAIMEHLWTTRREIPVLDEDITLSTLPGSPTDDDARSTDTWRALGRIIQNPQDEQLAYLRFVLGIKPKEIIRLYPQVWESEREVSVALQRIRRKLLRASDLGEL
jgi:hypothetical protein